jgi:hypothetical protein
MLLLVGIRRVAPACEPGHRRPNVLPPFEADQNVCPVQGSTPDRAGQCRAIN